MNNLLWFEYFLVYIGQWKCRKILLIIDTYMHIVHFKINFLTNFVFGLGLPILFWDIPHLSTLIHTVSKELHIHNKHLLTVSTILQGSFMKCVMRFIKLVGSYKASRECERTKRENTQRNMRLDSCDIISKSLVLWYLAGREKLH